MTTPMQGPRIWRQPLDPTTTPRTTLLFQWRLLPLEPSPLWRSFPHCTRALSLSGEKVFISKYLRTACLSLDLSIPATNSLPLFAMLTESFRLELAKDLATVVSLWKSLGVG